MVKGITNSKVSNGETLGQTVYLFNDSGEDINKGDKVLVNMGRIKDESVSCFSIISTENYCDLGCIFIDGDRVVSFFRNAMCLFSFFDGCFVKSDISHFNIPYGGGFVAFPFGVVSMCSMLANISSATNKGSILSSVGNRLLPNDYFYLGRFQGVDYVKSFFYGSVYKYDMNGNMLCDNIGDVDVRVCTGYLCSETGKGFVDDVNYNVTFFEIKTDTSLVVENTVAVNSIDEMRLVGWTGANIGDYLFYATNYESKYLNNASVNADVISRLIVYKIVSDINGKRTLVEASDKFKEFYYVDCLIQYDNRNNVLCIGTRNNVFAFKFNKKDDVFERIDLDFGLEGLSSSYCYRLVLSPGLDKALVTARISKDVQNCFCYNLGNFERKIVKNDMFNYANNSSFVGFATGNKSDENVVEVNVLLPDKVVVNISTNVDVSDGEIVIKGAL